MPPHWARCRHLSTWPLVSVQTLPVLWWYKTWSTWQTCYYKKAPTPVSKTHKESKLKLYSLNYFSHWNSHLISFQIALVCSLSSCKNFLEFYLLKQSDMVTDKFAVCPVGLQIYEHEGESVFLPKKRKKCDIKRKLKFEEKKKAEVCKHVCFQWTEVARIGFNSLCITIIVKKGMRTQYFTVFRPFTKLHTFSHNWISQMWENLNVSPW